MMFSPNCVRTPRRRSTTSLPSLWSTSWPPSKSLGGAGFFAASLALFFLARLIKRGSVVATQVLAACLATGSTLALLGRLGLLTDPLVWASLVLVLGFLALSQVPNGIAVVGILLVVAAGIGAERTGARAAAPPHSPRDPVAA